MRTGILYDESFADYHAADAVSSTRLDDVQPRPIRYFRRYVERSAPPRADSPALAFGRLFHCLALEGESVLAARYVVAPVGIDRRTKAGKEEYAAFTSRAAGREVVDAADIELAQRMVDSIRAKPAAVEMLARGSPEVTFRHQLASFYVQARVDWYDGIAAAGPILVNLKSIETLEDFDDQYHRYHYYRSDAFYRLVVAKVLGLPPAMPQIVNLVVEKTDPFECEIRVPDAQALEIGTRHALALLGTLDRCYSSGVWPGAAAGLRPVSLPEWLLKREERNAAL
jgi:hypothetical protein